jgi:hypothetical protein
MYSRARFLTIQAEMRPPVFCFGLVMLEPLAAQESDRQAEQELAHQVDSFSVVVRQQAALITAAGDIDTIHAAANDLVQGASLLIQQIETLHPPDKDLLFEVELQQNMSLSLLTTEPAMAVVYQQRAHEAQEQLDAAMPHYYAPLRRVLELSQRITGARRVERAWRIGEELREVEVTAGVPVE